MIDAVNELLKQLRKSYQKSSVRAIGAVGMQKNTDNKNKVSKKGSCSFRSNVFFNKNNAVSGEFN